jgi:DNA integrity scanning protein DisA with diadenylate cyclase activity
MVMGNRWNEAIELFRGVFVISIIIWLVTIFIPPQQLLNTLISVLKGFIIALAIAFAFMFIIREYEKRKEEW